MAVTIKQTDTAAGPVVVLMVATGFQSSDVQEAISEQISAGNNRFVIDLSGLSFVESSGLGALVNAYKFCQANNAKIAFCCLQSYVQKLFEITKLHQILNVCPTADEAVEEVSEA